MQILISDNGRSRDHALRTKQLNLDWSLEAPFIHCANANQEIAVLLSTLLPN